MLLFVCCLNSYLGISGNRMPSSSTKIPPAARTCRWWSEYSANRAVVGVSLSPLWSLFFRGLNSSSRNTSHTTKFLKVLQLTYYERKYRKYMSDLLCKLEHVKNELFHFYSVRFVWFANLAGGINMRNLLFCNVMMQHSFLITSKIDERQIIPIILYRWESVVS